MVELTEAESNCATDELATTSPLILLAPNDVFAVASTNS